MAELTAGFLNSNAAAVAVEEVNRGWFQYPVTGDWDVEPLEDGTGPIVDGTEFTQLSAPLSTDMTQGDQIPGIAAATWDSAVRLQHSGDATGVEAPNWFKWAVASGMTITDSVGNGTGLAWLVYDKTHLCNTFSVAVKDYRCGATAGGFVQYMHGAVSSLTIDMPGVNQPITISQSWNGVYGTGVLAGTGTISATGTAVTGVGTAFTTELVEGKDIRVGDEVRTIDTITDDTNLTLSSAFTVDPSGSAFDYLSSDDLREEKIAPETPQKYTDLDTTNVGTLQTTFFKIGDVLLELVSATVSNEPTITADTNSSAPGGVNWYTRDVGSVTSNVVVKKVDPDVFPAYEKVRDEVTENIVISLKYPFDIELNLCQTTASQVEKGDLNRNQNITVQVDNFAIKQRATA